jgi:hypothetical protein
MWPSGGIDNEAQNDSNHRATDYHPRQQTIIFGTPEQLIRSCWTLRRVAQGANVILTEEHRPSIFCSHRSLFYLEPERLQLRVEDAENRIAGEPLREYLTADLFRHPPPE